MSGADFVIESGILKQYSGPGGNVIIPEGVTDIGCGTFWGGHGLSRVVVPAHVTRIQARAFGGCPNLKQVAILAECVTLEGFLFQHSNVESIRIESRDASIQKQCFDLMGMGKGARLPGASGAMTVVPSVPAIHLEHLAPTVLPVPARIFALHAFAREYCAGTSISDQRKQNHLTYIRQNRADLLYAKDLYPDILDLAMREQMIDEAEFPEVLGLVQEVGDTALIAAALDYQKKHFASNDPTAMLLEQLDEAPGDALSRKEADALWMYDTMAKNGGIRILGYQSRKPNVRVPEQIDGIRVTEIGDGAFTGKQHCERAWRNFSSMLLPYGIQRIGAWAFFCCSSLASMTIPESVTEIGPCAFFACGALADVWIPASVQEIGDQAFLECQHLTIHAPVGSCAETYAKENQIPFAPM